MLIILFLRCKQSRYGSLERGRLWRPSVILISDLPTEILICAWVQLQIYYYAPKSLILAKKSVPADNVRVLRKGFATCSANCPVNASLFVGLLFPVLHQWLEFKYLKLVSQQSKELNGAYIWTVQPISLMHCQDYLFFRENKSFWLGTWFVFVWFGGCFFFEGRGPVWLQEFKNSEGKYQIILLIFELKGDTIKNILSAFHREAPPPFAPGEQDE